MSTKRRFFFLMIDHPSGKQIRVGPAYSTREQALSWKPFVSAAWKGCRVSVSAATFTFCNGAMDAQSVRILNDKYNMDPPGGGA